MQRATDAVHFADARASSSFLEPTVTIQPTWDEIAHMVATWPEGARYNGAWTKDQINDRDNLVVVCRPHHRQVARQESTCPTLPI